VIGAERLLADRERAPYKPLGVAVLALRLYTTASVLRAMA